jgi:hypothetical protein
MSSQHGKWSRTIFNNTKNLREAKSKGDHSIARIEAIGATGIGAIRTAAAHGLEEIQQKQTIPIAAITWGAEVCSRGVAILMVLAAY